MNELRSLVLKAIDSNLTLAERQLAFGELVGIFQDMAYACAYARLGDFYVAQDAAQEAFISAWQRACTASSARSVPTVVQAHSLDRV